MKQRMKKWKIWLWVIGLVLMGGSFPITAKATEGNIASGVIEDGGRITWVIDANGKLTVNGTGDFGFKPPWVEYGASIVSAEINVTGATTARAMFYNCYRLKEIDLSGFDTSQITNMGSMFVSCGSLEKIDLSGFDTSQVTTMVEMFEGCSSLKKLDLSSFDTGQVTDMYEMFRSCKVLEELDISSFNTSQVSDMAYMFYNCDGLKKLDISNFDTSQVTDMDSLFRQCDKLTEMNLSSLDTSQVINMHSMFNGCDVLERVNLSGLDISQVTNMAYMFNECVTLKEITLNFEGKNSLKTTESMFRDCSSLEKVDFVGFDTSQVTDMTHMFANCTALTEIDLKVLDTSQVTEMQGMFSLCSALKKINLSSLDTSKVTNMYSMFAGCSSLAEIDLGELDTSQVTWMSDMFRGCSLLKKIDLSSLDISKVTGLDGIFQECSSLEEINLANIDTSRVTTMARMFKDCRTLREIDLKDFDTSQVTGLSDMFEGCVKLKEIDLSGFDTRRVKYLDDMFYGCTALKKLNLSNFDLSNISSQYYVDGMFYDCKSLEQIQTPRNCMYTIDLPGSSGDKWYNSEGQQITELPQNLMYSITIAKNRIPEELTTAVERITEILSAKSTPTNKSSILVVDSATGKPLKGVAVTVDNETFVTDDNGIVHTSLKGEYRIDVTVGDKIVRSALKRLEYRKYVTLTVVPNSDELRIFSTNITIDQKKEDVTDQTVYLTHKKLDKISDEEKTDFVLEMEVNGNPQKFQLVQNGKVIQENISGRFKIPGCIEVKKNKTVYYTDEFEAGYPVYVKAFGDKGEVCKQRLGLKIAEITAEDVKFDLLYGDTKPELSIGEKFKMTVPNDIPLLGGGSLEFGFLEDCPVQVGIDDDGVVRIAVNMGEFDTSDNGAWYQMKENYQNLSKRALKAANSSGVFGGEPQSFGSGMVSIKAKVAGYGEGYLSEIENGRLKVNVGIIAEGSAGVSYTKYFFVHCVPVYIDFTSEGTLEIDGHTNLLYENAKFSIEGGNVTIKPSISEKLKGGVGAEDLLDVYVSGKLTFAYQYRLADSYQRLDLKGDAEVGLNVWVYNKPMLELDKTWVLYDSNRKTSTYSLSGRTMNLNITDLSGADIISLDYLDKRSDSARILRTRGIPTEASLVLDYAFMNASPKLLKTEDALYLFYLDGVEGREAQNQTALFYRKSTDGGVSWSLAMRVDNNANETADYNYDAVVSGNDVYVVWSDAGKVYKDELVNMDSEDGIELISKDMNLMMAHIDGENSEITTQSFGTEQADLQPNVFADEDGNVHILWMTNDISSEDGMFSVDNEFKLLYTSSAQEFAVTEMAIQEGGYPLSLDLAMFDKKISAVVNLDVDQDLETQEDRELYLWYPDQNQGLIQFTSNEVIDSVPGFASVAGKDSLFWYQGGNIVYTSDGKEIYNVFTEDHPVDIGQEFEVLEGTDGKAAIVWTVSSLENEKGIEMYCADFDGADWSAAYKLSDLHSQFTTKLSGYLDEEDYRIAYLGRKSEERSIHSGIYLMKPEERIDTVIGYSMEANGAAGEVYPITLNVENTGNTVVTELLVTSEDGTVSETVDGLSIAPGTREELVYNGICLLNEMSEVYTCNLSIKAPGESDSDNNIVPVSIGHPDFEISAWMDYSAGCYLASIALENNGIMQSDAVLKVYRDENLTRQLYETEIPAVMTGETRALVLNADTLDNTAEALYFVVSDKNETEIHLEDNKALIYVGKGNGREDRKAGNGVTRLFGGNRFDTGFAAAEEYKKLLDTDKFKAVVVATGYNSADALSGSYLAVQNEAPILLADPNNVNTLVDYVKSNLAEDGKVYILGGTGAVPADVEEKLADHTEDICRLKGSDRFDTNIEILKEAGIENTTEILVATGWAYADSLSASAVNKPIMLVDKALTDAQKTMLDKLADDAVIYILGGTAAVSETVEAELAAYGAVDRVKGADRFGTSVAIAEKFFGTDVEAVTFAYGWNYPDGLCGGPVAAEANAPVLLVHKGATDAAAEYAAGIESGYIFGGSGAVADETVKAVLGEEIQITGTKYVTK